MDTLPLAQVPKTLGFLKWDKRKPHVTSRGELLIGYRYRGIRAYDVSYDGKRWALKIGRLYRYGEVIVSARTAEELFHIIRSKWIKPDTTAWVGRRKIDHWCAGRKSKRLLPLSFIRYCDEDGRWRAFPFRGAFCPGCERFYCRNGSKPKLPLDAKRVTGGRIRRCPCCRAWLELTPCDRRPPKVIKSERDVPRFAVRCATCFVAGRFSAATCPTHVPRSERLVGRSPTPQERALTPSPPAPAGQYPYVVVRYMATVYGHFPVRFVEDEAAVPPEFTDAFVIPCRDPFVDGRLTIQAREALLDAVRFAIQKTGHRMNAVFGERDCAYCEFDGSVNGSFNPPSGGIQCLRFPVRFR